MLLHNAEISASAQTAEKAAWAFGVHEVIAIILFLMYIILFGIYTIGELKKTIANDRKWETQPTLSKVKVATKGIIGLTTAAYVIYLLITWSSWQGMTAASVFILPPVLGTLFSFSLALIYLFGYNFLYKPMATLISYLKKKE